MGAFIERLIAGDLVSLLENRGIPVKEINARKKLYREEKTVLAEYDLVAYNGDAIVVTKVKTTLTINKVINSLTNYKFLFDLRVIHMRFFS